MSPIEVTHHETWNEQYSRRKIFGLWALVTLPMVLLAWGVAPILIPRLKLPAIAVYLLLMVLGMLWQLVLSLWMIRREQGDLRWETIRRRVWLNPPLHPNTGQPRRRLYWWLLPCLLLASLSLAFGVFATSFNFVLMMLLSLPESVTIFNAIPYTTMTELAVPELSGQWWLLGLVVIAWALSAFFAEEFFFRGILLPKMNGAFGKSDWLVNAILYGLYYLYKPWMILFRLIGALAVAWPARRFRSNWMAAIVRGVEGAGLVAFVLVGILSPSLTSLQTPLTVPHITRQPAAQIINSNRVVTSLPTYDPNSDNDSQVDLCSSDLSSLDLRNSSKDLFYADFDTRTVWPPADRMPADFDPQQIMEIGKDPGLGLRQLRAQGITGQGVNIAIIDMRLLTDHQEYNAQLRWYEEINVGAEETAQMHGSAVASIAVGETVGVAPQAGLYYIGISSYLTTQLFLDHYEALGIRRILEINRQLPEDQKIRVISISAGWDPDSEAQEAAEEARDSGIFVIYSSLSETYGLDFLGLGRDSRSDPNEFLSYEPGLFWQDRFYERGFPTTRAFLLVPMDSRTTASPTGTEDYVFYRSGGLSWSIPYVAGMYALAVQVKPDISPEEFWETALATGQTIQIQHDGRDYEFGVILDPQALIEALQAE
ncbi:MAG: S8/S53 family peptidase [Chloroflexota bacterium]